MTLSLDLTSQINLLEMQVTQNTNNGFTLEAELLHKYKREIEKLRKPDLSYASNEVVVEDSVLVDTISISEKDNVAVADTVIDSLKITSIISISEIEKLKQFSRSFILYGCIMLCLSALSLLTGISAFTFACILLTFTIGFTFLYTLSTTTPTFTHIKPAIAIYGIISTFSLAILSLIIIVINSF